MLLVMLAICRGGVGAELYKSALRANHGIWQVDGEDADSQISQSLTRVVLLRSAINNSSPCLDLEMLHANGRLQP